MHDFIIIGAGSAGCVLANRLSQKGSVLLLEAGPVNHRWDPRLHMPAALSELLKSETYNWHYWSEPEPCLGNRRLYCPRGRVLGGSSSINGMIFVRGNPADFDRWASVYGLDNWSYELCLPYFMKSETAAFGDPDLRGQSGPQAVSRGNLDNPLTLAWLEAVEQAGYPITDDFNGVQQEGGGPFDRSITAGVRQSTALSYLAPAMGRQGLEVVTGARVTRLLIEQGRVTGVEYFTGRERHRIHAASEVILSGGAINSPGLLMQSGIGDASHLEQHDIKVLLDQTQVGRNLQDHLEIYVQWESRKPVSIYPATRWYRKPLVGLQWLLNQSGAGATNHFEAGAFLKSSLDVAYPDLQFHFLPIAMDYDGKDQFMGHGFQVHVGPMKPASRGTLMLSSADPNAPPVIRFNYNTEDADRQVMRSGIRLAKELVAQQAFDEYRGRELRPGVPDESDEALDAFIRAHAESAYHPCGTCRMGTDADAVVDSVGRVNGLNGLRIVDASIMPEITNGNLNAVVIMMAEKIADQV